LLLIAWHTQTITTNFLKSPGHMIGDLVLLPLAGFLITKFYHEVSDPTPSVGAKVHTYLAAILAISATTLATMYSVLVSNNYQGLWSAPHTIFILFLAYILINFLIKALTYLYSRSNSRLWLNYFTVITAIAAHIALKLI